MMKRTDERIKRTEIDVTDRKYGLRRGVPALLKGHKVQMVERSWLGYSDEERAERGEETRRERKQEIVYSIDGQEVRDLRPNTVLRTLGLPTYTTEEVEEMTGIGRSQIRKYGSVHGRGVRVGNEYRWTEADVEYIQGRIGKRGRPSK